MEIKQGGYSQGSAVNITFPANSQASNPLGQVEATRNVHRPRDFIVLSRHVIQIDRRLTAMEELLIQPSVRVTISIS